MGNYDLTNTWKRQDIYLLWIAAENKLQKTREKIYTYSFV